MNILKIAAVAATLALTLVATAPADAAMMMHRGHMMMHHGMMRPMMHHRMMHRPMMHHRMMHRPM